MAVRLSDLLILICALSGEVQAALINAAALLIAATVTVFGSIWLGLRAAAMSRERDAIELRAARDRDRTVIDGEVAKLELERQGILADKANLLFQHRLSAITALSDAFGEMLWVAQLTTMPEVHHDQSREAFNPALYGWSVAARKCYPFFDETFCGEADALAARLSHELASAWRKKEGTPHPTEILQPEFGNLEAIRLDALSLANRALEIEKLSENMRVLFESRLKMFQELAPTLGTDKI